MKKKKIEKKLLLNKSTISSLNQNQLKNIMGAGTLLNQSILQRCYAAVGFDIHSKTILVPDTSTVNPNTMTSRTLSITGATINITVNLNTKFNMNGLI